MKVFFYLITLLLIILSVVHHEQAQAMVESNSVCSSFYGTQKSAEYQMHLILCNELAQHWNQPTAGGFVSRPASQFLAADDTTLKKVITAAQSKMIKSGLKFKHMNDDEITRLSQKALQESVVDGQPLRQSLSMLVFKLALPMNVRE